MTRKILRVDSIELRVTKGEGGTLVIVAEGNCSYYRLGSWPFGSIPFYIQAPIDGIYDFDFVAEPTCWHGRRHAYANHRFPILGIIIQTI